MGINDVMPLRDVKNSLSEVVSQVERDHSRVTITKHGRPAAVVMSADDLASLEETLEILSNPDLLSRVRSGLADAEAGRGEIMTKEELLDSLRS